MKAESPYVVCDDMPGRYAVQRKCDGIVVGYILQVADSWEIEEPTQLEGPNRPSRNAVGQSKPLSFKSHDDAALFLCMRGRAYQKIVSIEDPAQSLEIRITPNFDDSPWSTCLRGHWKATLFDGAKSVGHCCADSLEGAKREGLRKAYYTTSLPEYSLQQMSDEGWMDTPDPAPQSS